MWSVADDNVGCVSCNGSSCSHDVHDLCLRLFEWCAEDRDGDDDVRKVGEVVDVERRWARGTDRAYWSNWPDRRSGCAWTGWATGLPGPQGAVGPTGVTGATGATGPAGPQGLKGDTGATGAAGANGQDGLAAPALAGSFQAGFGAASVMAVGNDVWTADEGDAAVTRVDRITGAVKAVVHTGGMPYGLTYDGTYIWTGVQNPGYLDKIDPATNTVVQSIHVNDSTGGVLYDSGSIWVVGFAQPAPNLPSSLVRVDPTTGATQASIAIPGSLGLIAFKGYIWVANRASDTISKIDPTTNSVVDTITDTGQPFEIVNDGTYLWVSNRVSGTLSKIDATTDQILDVVTVGEALGLAFDGRSLWVGGFSTGNITRVDPKADKITGVLNVGGHPHAVAWDGSHIWATQFDNNTLYRIYAGH